MVLITYTNVQEKQPPAATEGIAIELEALGDIIENVVDAGRAVWVDEGEREVGVLDAADTDPDALEGHEYYLMKLLVYIEEELIWLADPSQNC